MVSITAFVKTDHCPMMRLQGSVGPKSLGTKNPEIEPNHETLSLRSFHKEWVRLQDMSGPRKAHGSILFKGRIYLFFGRTDNEYEK